MILATPPPTVNQIWTPATVRQEVESLLDPSVFASWLRSQPSERPLYDERVPGGCSLALYLHDHGFVHVTVTPWDCFADGLDAPVELPRWAKSFVRAIDRGDAVYSADVIAVFASVLADFADRDRPMAFEDWRESKVAS